MKLSDDEWKKKLTPEQYKVLRQKGTEAPFTSKFLDNKTDGMYACSACGAELFHSDSKYNADSPGLEGWPSFSEVTESGAVKLVPDNSLGMERTEVVCANCGGHLGHVFDEASSPTGQHFCINGCILDFKPGNKETK